MLGVWALGARVLDLPLVVTHSKEVPLGLVNLSQKKGEVFDVNHVTNIFTTTSMEFYTQFRISNFVIISCDGSTFTKYMSFMCFMGFFFFFETDALWDLD